MKRVIRSACACGVALVAGVFASGCAAHGEQRIATERLPEVRHVVAWEGELAAAEDASARRADWAWSELVHEASRADVVLIGEIHGHEPGLDAAARLFADIVAERERMGARNRPALAMEFFERDDQLAIDDYLAGLIDEEAFRERTRRTERNYYGHRDMVELAKAEGLAVRGANAPRRYVSLARTQGEQAYDGFTPEQARLVIMPERLADAGYSERFGNIMSAMGRGHSEDGEEEPGQTEQPETDPMENPVIQGFYRSQNVWDITMADTVVELVRDGHRPVVLVVGQFHTDHDGGLTRRVRGRLGSGDVFVVSMAAEDPTMEGLREEDARRADAVVYTGPVEE